MIFVTNFDVDGLIFYCPFKEQSFNCKNLEKYNHNHTRSSEKNELVSKFVKNELK